MNIRERMNEERERLKDLEKLESGEQAFPSYPDSVPRRSDEEITDLGEVNEYKDSIVPPAGMESDRVSLGGKEKFIDATSKKVGTMDEMVRSRNISDESRSELLEELGSVRMKLDTMRASVGRDVGALRREISESLERIDARLENREGWKDASK